MILYHYESIDINVDIVARFDGESLIIDGCDIAERVNEYWGDSAYEYLITIPPASVTQLYDVL